MLPDGLVKITIMSLMKQNDDRKQSPMIMTHKRNTKTSTKYIPCTNNNPKE